MIRFPGLRGLGACVGVGLMVVACGGSSSGPVADKGTITVASDLPTSGADASDGVPTQNGVQFAFDNFKAKLEAKGFKVVYNPLDDAINGTHDPQKGAQNVQSLLGDKTVLGMVGAFNSNVTKAELPIANPAGLAMVSPSNTNECLTRDPDNQCQSKANFTPAGLRPSGVNTYFRVAADDTKQGPAMAKYAVEQLKVSKIAVWNDGETFGLGVATHFKEQFVKSGGTVVSDKTYDSKSKSDFHDFLNDAKDKGATAIYVGATSGTKACVGRGQSAGIMDGPNNYYLVPDGGANDQCLKDSGSLANDHIYATLGVGGVGADPSVAKLVNDFKAKYPDPKALGGYTFAAYDCMGVLMDAIGRAIDANGGNMPTRKQVVDALTNTKDFASTSGPLSFTKDGDPTNPALSIKQNKGGAFTTISTVKL